MAQATQELAKKEAQAPEGAERTTTAKVYRPDVDIIEKKDSIVLIADMPGVDEKSVDVNLENRVLTITGKIDAPALEGYSEVGTEYGIGDYERVFSLSEEIDGEKISAALKNGVLRLVLPKAESARIKKIEVKAE